MAAVPVCHFHLPGCTEALCKTKCMPYANKFNKGVKLSKCDKPDICHYELSAAANLAAYHPTSHGLPDAEDDNKTFV